MEWKPNLTILATSGDSKSLMKLFIVQGSGQRFSLPEGVTTAS